LKKKDIGVLLEQISYGNNPEAAARDIILHVQKFGREFM
jgi:hypothetical protein